MRSRSLAKALCQADEADIQDHAAAQNIFTGSFLHTNYYYYGEANVRTDTPYSAAFMRV